MHRLMHSLQTCVDLILQEPQLSPQSSKRQSTSYNHTSIPTARPLESTALCTWYRAGSSCLTRA